jgi:beta-glucosidase
VTPANASSRFPRGFIWGASTSAPQIEGAATEDGRGASIWDVFAAGRGRIADGSAPYVAADHYHRMHEDVALMRALGIKAYRFSIAWPRVIPDGDGEINEAGLAFYDRLVDALVEAGIEPWACLYHWDLPYGLEASGGWSSRGVVDAFERYTKVVADRLGDRVKTWVVLNEASTFTIEGYLTGRHAPGVRNVRRFMQAVHCANLAQGRAVAALRAAGAQVVTTAVSISPIHPVSGSEQDREAAARLDQFAHGIFLDPLLTGTYPPAVHRLLRLADVQRGDMDVIHQPVDLIGANIYRHFHVEHDPRIPVLRAHEVAHQDADSERTAMGWEVAPWSMSYGVTHIWREYGIPIVILENGAAFEDVPGPDGRVEDVERARFLARYIEELRHGMREGADVRGYFVWSLLDNWEWAEGFRRRFGIVRVDYDTQRRIVKRSGDFYARMIRAGGPEVSAGQS